VSWDVFIMKYPEEAQEIGDIPNDWVPPSLGTGAEVRRILTRTLAGITFSGDGWGCLEGRGFSLETPVSEADDEPVTGVTLFIRGGGAAAAAAVAVTEALGARAIETGSGGFLTADAAEAAFAAWRSYRDTVLRE
jgi:hypothetical protein